MTMRPAPTAAVNLRGNTLPAANAAAQPGAMWWNALSVLVTRPIAPNRIATTPHLVLPAEYGRLNFLLSSYDIESEQLARDRRVVIQAGDWRGRPALGSRQHYGIVRIVRDDNWAARLNESVRTKHGLRSTLARIGHRFSHGTAPYGDLVATIDLQPYPPRMLAP
ncbi:hypothetical protein ACWDOP_13120 [Nocardia sp. NPDC003693]